MWTDSLEIFLDGYEPAKDLTDSSHQFSTIEILQTVINHCQEEINPQELVKSMEDMGYKYTRTGDLQMEWLLRRIEQG